MHIHKCTRKFTFANLSHVLTNMQLFLPSRVCCLYTLVTIHIYKFTGFVLFVQLDENIRRLAQLFEEQPVAGNKAFQNKNCDITLVHSETTLAEASSLTNVKHRRYDAEK